MSRHAGLLAGCALALICGALSAAQPSARPDFTGIWLPDESRAQAWPATLPLTPAARRFMQEFNPASHDSTSYCMPFGTPRNMLQTQYPVQIIQTADRVVMVVQPDLSNAEVRRVPLAGALPKDPDPSWFGTSRGRWEGSTLVIETTGLREDSIINGQGMPHSDQLRVIERLALVNDPVRGKVLVNDIELVDPAAYTAPIRTRRYYASAPQANLQEGSCVARKWIDKLWRDRLQEHADARKKAGAP
jgi:hypothetical protein